MINKKALIIYDDPLIEVKTGTQNRVINILENLKKFGICID